MTMVKVKAAQDGSNKVKVKAVANTIAWVGLELKQIAWKAINENTT